MGKVSLDEVLIPTYLCAAVCVFLLLSECVYAHMRVCVCVCVCGIRGGRPPLTE